MNARRILIAFGFVAICSLSTAGSAWADASVPNDRLCDGPNTASNENPPVYLMQDSSHSLYRLEVRPTSTGAAEVHRFAVVTGEIVRLCNLGIEVRVLPGLESAKAAPPPRSVNCNTPSVPSSFAIFRMLNQYYGIFCTTATRPAGKTTQWLDFTMKSTAFNGTGLHAPIVLFLNGAALGGSSPQILGNGIIIGDVHNRTTSDGGCGSTSWPTVPIYDSQVETFYGTGNWIWGSTCDLYGAYDGTSYTWDIQANSNSWVSYTKTGGGHSYSPPAVHTLDHNPTFDSSQGGILFDVTDDVPGPDFRLSFSGVSTGWF